MVKRFLLFSLLFFPLSPISAWSEDLSYEAYMDRIGTGQRKIDHSNGLIKNSDLHTHILERDALINEPGSSSKTKQTPQFWRDSPKEREANTPSAAQSETPTPVTTQPETEALAKANDKLKALEAELARLKKPNSNVTKARKTTKPSGKPGPVKYVYVPPSLRDSRASVSNQRQIKTPVKNITFGITIGTRIPVRLKTSASNVEPGYIQFQVEQDIVGDKKSLPKGSTLFCRASAVLGSPRLFVSAVKGITQGDHMEFNLRGNVFAEDGKAGLIATLINDGRGLARAKDAGVTVLGAGLIDMIPGSTITTEAGKAAAELVINENRSENNQKHGRPNYVLDAEPQLAVLQIEETF